MDVLTSLQSENIVTPDVAARIENAVTSGTSLETALLTNGVPKDTVRKKMADLRCLEKVLKELLTQCQSNQDDSHCPIIDSLQP